jgi:hypothetical protein
MKIRVFTSTSARKRDIVVNQVGTSFEVSVDDKVLVKFTGKATPDTITEKLQKKEFNGAEIKRVFAQIAKLGKADSREVKVKPSAADSKTKKQLFSDATVRLVAKEFPEAIATLAQLNKTDRAKAYARSHHGLGMGVRNFMRSKTTEKAVRNPVTADDIWSEVLDRAIELKLYKDTDADVYQLAKITGNAVKELDMVLYKDADSVKKLGASIARSLKKAFGDGMTIKARVREHFSPSPNVPAHRYNHFAVSLPINMITVGGNNKLNIYVGTGIVMIEEDGPKSTKVTNHKLVKGTNAEVLEAITKNLKIKTNTVEKPASTGKFNEASQYVVDKFGKDLKAKGIDLIPTPGGISFYHPRRGTVKARFGIKNGKMMHMTKYKASFGETFDMSKPISKAVISKIVAPLLK